MAQKQEGKLSLSEKFDSLIHANPTFVDDDEDDLTKVNDIVPTERSSDCSGDELDLRQFRKLNIEFLDAEDSKYSGKKSSRVEHTKAFESDSSDVEDSTDENAEQSQFQKEYDCDDSDDESSPVRSDFDMEAKETLEEEDVGDNQCHSKSLNEIFTKSSDDIKKGNAIRNQLLIWDFLLEYRLKFQKCLLSSNQLPDFQKLKKFITLGGEDFEKLLNETQASMRHLLHSLMQLQDMQLRKNDDYRSSALKHKISSDEESDGGNCDRKKSQVETMNLTDFSSEIGDRHKKMETFRNQVIQKWNDKTRITHLNSKNFNAFEQSTLKQIEQVLLDKHRLIKRTQIKRSNYHILGQNDIDDDDGSPPKKQIKIDDVDNMSMDNADKKTDRRLHKEIFDDDDFYHQLLSEYIKRKSYNVSDPIELGKQWIQLEKIRSKMKKKVDTRATKGRKIRYVVHPKLVNFMMPIESSTYSEGSRRELFNSIFGKNQKL